MFEPSPEQLSIFSAIADPSGPNVLVNACPGSGKTETSMRGMSFCRKSASFIPTSILYLAFAKANVDEAKTRAPQGVTVSTFHSLGLRALKDSGTVSRNVTIAGTFDFKTKKKVPPKVGKLVWDVLGSTDPEAQNVIRLVGLLKSGCEADDEIAQGLCDAHNIEVSQKNRSLALKVLEKSDANLDFDDMLRLPVILGLKFAPWDYVFVDEAQDTNEVQAEILARLARPVTVMMEHFKSPCPTRFVIVGDPHQSIYGFRGAQTSAMDVLRSRFSCVSLPLSISYRCPQAVVAEAQRVLSLTL
jgi:DNA helicase-2/ATP-dependent DNA helicase PcrA